MTVGIHNAITTVLSRLKTREPLTGSEWADRYFYLVPESSGIEGKWATFPYQIAWLNWMTDDDIREINNQKCARVGYTKCIVAAIGYFTEERHRNIVVWQPTDGDAQDFVSDEIDPMLNYVPIVGDLLKCRVGMKSKYNTNEKKSFNGSVLDIKGGKSARNYRRMTKDVAIFDEADGFDIDIDGEGHPFKLGDIRTQTSPFRKSIRGSTPGVKGVSIIEPAVDSSGMVFYRYVPCPQCNTMQRLEFKNLRTKGEEKGQYTCIHGCLIDYSSYPDMDLSGRWQTLDGYYYDDNKNMFFSPDGHLTERPKKISTRIWAAYSYYMSWAEIVEEWLEAVAKSAIGDKTLLKTFINTFLGETWEEKGEQVSHGMFTGDRLDNYRADGRIPDEVLVITVGGDLQGGKESRLELEICGWGIGFESWSIDYVIIPGDPQLDAMWDHLDDQFLRKFTREDGTVIPVAGGCIDSGYLPDRVFNFTGPRARRNIYATKGKAQYSGPLIKASSEQWKNKKILQLAINTDNAKETVFTRLNKILTPGPGYCHFPSHYGADYFKKLTNEEKRIDRKGGVIVGHKWVKLGPNEPLDCRTGNLAALARLNPNFETIKLYYRQRVENIKLELPPAAGQVVRSGRRVRSAGVQR